MIGRSPFVVQFERVTPPRRQLQADIDRAQDALDDQVLEAARRSAELGLPFAGKGVWR